MLLLVPFHQFHLPLQVLDVGTGTGNNAIFLAQSGHQVLTEPANMGRLLLDMLDAHCAACMVTPSEYSAVGLLDGCHSPSLLHPLVQRVPPVALR